ncbi:four helix bundle protein [Antarcticibacterium flavum]|uniref:Four helix bundle protein n=1 Tax=Antarcticibacterium flavum TaxID=2058175 RepID=A0A5B7X523_9FLAO|nr:MULTISPECIES: four helix bundle protein [Antarcticibacterium]MCM4161743.1 four helix bundle protein [Antarcticibacterium sp. W02-3]QCY70536.1 four helix bundle protein [Antarcticibacterium flavum]
MQDPVFNFENLQVYQKSLDFVDLAYEVSRQFPKSELYNLTSQFKRASVSISLNIAEGAGDTDAQFNRFLQIAMDSIKECVVCSTIARRQNFIDVEQDNINRAKLTELSKMTGSLQRYLNKKVK